MSNKMWKALLGAGMLAIVTNTLAEVGTVSDELAIKQRVHMLEMAFYPTQPDTVAKFYAKAVMDHNGALQYMVLSPDLRQSVQLFLQGKGWVTGIPGPKIVSYDVVNIARAAKLWTYAIHFNLERADGRSYSCVNHIEIGKVMNPEFGISPVWAITKLEFLAPTEC
ncbi:MAG: hypothetical protein WBE18_07440 [Gammaproteobacteria bacterium]